MLPLSPFGTAEQMSVIDKVPVEGALEIFKEYRLPIVDMLGADIDHPGQPEALVITHSFEACPGQDFKQSDPRPA